MSDALAHRGPDDAGSLALPEHRLFWAHRRLSILDLSPAGHQPMRHPDVPAWIVFNGEIYNFRELRRNLERDGLRFRTRTDTEVLLQGLARHGMDFVRRLNGIFAFAWTDLRQNKLWLVRDAFGVKPLYYWNAPGGVLFASEIKAILASGLYTPAPDQQACLDFFTYLCAPQGATMFRGIQQVPPAHWLEFRFDGTLESAQRYWRVDRAATQGNPTGDPPQEQAARVRQLLSESVRRQMVSDVPLGIFLGGGIDSAVLTGLMAQEAGGTVETFTVGFRGPGALFHDESERAAAVARHFGTRHHHRVVNLDDPWDLLRQGEWFDQPFGNPTAFLLHRIAELARSRVKVALCGAGGDELFGGYHRYRAMYVTRRLSPYLPLRLLRRAPRWIAWWPDAHRSPALRRVREFFAGLDSDPVRQFMHWSYYLDEQEKRKLLAPWLQTGQFLPSDRWVRGLLATMHSDPDNRWLQTDLECFLVDDILEYTDRATMALALETRTPFLDCDLASYAIRLPFRRKMRGRNSKIVLKQAFADLLPPGFAATRKRGFNAPLALWMLGPLDRYFDRFMGIQPVQEQGIFDWDYLQILRAEHRRGSHDHAAVLFAVISFDLWHRRHFRGEHLDFQTADLASTAGTTCASSSTASI
ncbi:MAG TPA: asparagine synthase (glutamine-hydrolyzing), partial [Tepidisphaeraceae bacterium]|nr:asparagine synthase (glutamine-hydrolyzing) [Tepidisphaeraceae bacterium]